MSKTPARDRLAQAAFDKGEYLNPGPWRIPFHHRGVLSYAHRLNVPLEPFIQVNYNAYVHSTKAWGGKPENVEAGQRAYYHRAKLNSAATTGVYAPAMESELATA